VSRPPSAAWGSNGGLRASLLHRGSEASLLVRGEPRLPTIVGIRGLLAILRAEPVGIRPDVVPASGDVEVAEPHEWLRSWACQQRVHLGLPGYPPRKGLRGRAVVRDIRPQQLEMLELGKDHTSLWVVRAGGGIAVETEVHPERLCSIRSYQQRTARVLVLC